MDSDKIYTTQHNAEFEKWLWENAVLVVPRVVCREHGNQVFLEPVTWEEMESIKKQQGKL